MVEARGTRVELSAEGPVLVHGAVQVTAPDGRVVHSDRPVTALCTCRRSRRYPFCDTSHRTRLARDATEGSSDANS